MGCSKSALMLVPFTALAPDNACKSQDTQTLHKKSPVLTVQFIPDSSICFSKQEASGSMDKSAYRLEFAFC